MKPGTMNQEPGIEVKITIFVKKTKPVPNSISSSLLETFAKGIKQSLVILG